MRKTKKLLSLILGAVVAAGVASPICANALAMPIDNPLEAPNGYTVFDDGGVFTWATDTLEYDAFYKNTPEEYQTEFLLYHGHKYNYTELTVVRAELDAFKSMAEKYNSELEMDYFQESGLAPSSPATVLTARLYDMYDENGNRTKDPSRMEDKSDAIKEMCEEMYRAGYITEANYKGVVATGAIGYCHSMTVLPNTGNGESDLEALEKLVSEVAEYEEITYYENNESFLIEADYFNCLKITDAVKEAYPDATIHSGVRFLASSSPVSVGEINLLTAIQEETACDIDENGTVEITDATAILESYANTAAGIAAASAENPMDVNGDGAVGIDDATFVLTVYAELAAGIR